MAQGLVKTLVPALQAAILTAPANTKVHPQYQKIMMAMAPVPIKVLVHSNHRRTLNLIMVRNRKKSLFTTVITVEVPIAEELITGTLIRERMEAANKTTVAVMMAVTIMMGTAKKADRSITANR